MKRVVPILLALCCAAPASAVKVGQTWAEVEAELGKPVSRLNAPGRSIGRWHDLEVIFVDDRAVSFVRRDLAAEAASETRRKEEAERLKKQREEIDAERRRLEEERTAGEGGLLERERKAQAAKIAALEAQLETERRRLKVLNEKTEDRRREDAEAQAELLKKEIPLLRQEIQRTLSVGDAGKASALQRDLMIKETELKKLAKNLP